MVHRATKTWHYVSKIAIGIYLFTNSLFISLFIVVCVVYKSSHFVNSILTYLLSGSYFVLTICIAAYGWKLSRLIMNQKIKIPFLKNKFTLIIMTTILALVFLSHGLWEFVIYSFPLENVHIVVSCAC